MDNQTPPTANPIENPVPQAVAPSSPRSFLSKKTIFATFFVLIILAFIFVVPFPKYIGETACGAPCQDKNNCPPCPFEQWILEKPLFWSVILPMLKQNSSGRYIPISISPTPTPDPTTSWKTYENNKIGFTIKYPSRFASPRIPSGNESPLATGIEDDTTLVFGETTENSFSLLLLPSFSSPQDLITSQYASGLPPYKWIEDKNTTAKQESIKANNIDAIQVTANTNVNPNKNPFIGIFFTHNNHGFILHTGYGFDVKELQQILSTFKFL